MGLEDHLGQEIPGDLVHPVKKCNSFIPRDSSAPSWEYSDYSPVPGNFSPGFSQTAKAKGLIFFPCSNLCWKRDFGGHRKITPGEWLKTQDSNETRGRWHSPFHYCHEICFIFCQASQHGQSTGKRHFPSRWDTGANLSFLQLGILTTGPGIPRRPSGPGFPGAPWGPMGPVFPGGPSKPASPWMNRQGVELVLAHQRRQGVDADP